MSLKAKSDLSQRKRNLTFATDKSLCYWYCDKLSGGRGREGRHSNEQNEGYTRIWTAWNLKRLRRGLGVGGSDCFTLTDCANPPASNGSDCLIFHLCICHWSENRNGKRQVASCRLQLAERSGGGSRGWGQTDSSWMRRPNERKQQQNMSSALAG